MQLSSTHDFSLAKRVDLSRDFAAASWPPAGENVLAIATRLLPTADYLAAGTLSKLGQGFSVDLKVFDLLAPGKPVFFFATAPDQSGLKQAVQDVTIKAVQYSTRAFRVAAVAPSGNKRIDSGAILRKITTRKGDLYDQNILREDMKNVFRMGYFNDVRLEVADSPEGKNIIFHLTEKPLLTTIVFSGNDKLDEKELRESITITANSIYNPKRVKEAAEAIRVLYREKGYYTTQVSPLLQKTDNDRGSLVFNIKEGKKIYIKEITFTGNTFFSNKELKKIIETSEKGILSWLFDSGQLSETVARQDADRIAAHYHNHGFIEAKVAAPEITSKGEWLYVTFAISENERFRVGTVAVDGDLLVDKNTLLDMLSIRKEKFLNRMAMRQDVLAVTDFYAEKGYAFAEITPRISPNSGRKRVDISFAIDKGKLVHLNRLVVKGNTKTRDKVIRREMEIKEGGVFNSKSLRESQAKLTRLDFFEEIHITPQPVGGVGDLMDVIVDVKEKPTGTFSIGGGYSSVDHLMFMAEVSQKNFMGKGQNLSLSAELGGVTTRYRLNFTEPHFNDTELMVGFDLFDWEREYDDYTRQSQGAGIRFGYPVWEKWRSVLSYSFDNTDLTDVAATASRAIRDSQDIHITSAVKLGFSRDTRDNLYDPTKGSRTFLSAEFAGSVLGGDSAYTKIEGSTGWFYPIKWGIVGHIRLAAGQVFENTSGKLPVFEKFYLGGISTIRGFESGDISPKAADGTNDKIGGDKMWYTNLELIFPLFKEVGLKGVVFYDVGNVFDVDEDWDLATKKSAVGFGFRWMSPVGPLRLEYGVNLDPVDDEKSSVWDFTIGGAF